MSDAQLWSDAVDELQDTIEQKDRRIKELEARLENMKQAYSEGLDYQYYKAGLQVYDDCGDLPEEIWTEKLGKQE